MDRHQYFASFTIDAVKVEISTIELTSDLDVMETFGTGPWKHFSLAKIGEYVIPIVAIELRLVTEIMRGRDDRIESIIAYLKETNINKKLLIRALSTERPDYGKLNCKLIDSIKAKLGIS
jgi:hypothetical protein